METQGFYFKHRKDGSEAHLNVAFWVSVCMLWFLPAVAFGQVQTNQYSPDLDVQTDIAHFSIVSSDELSQNLLDYDMGGVDLFRLHESPMDAFHGLDSEALIGPVWNLGSDHFEADQAASWSKNGGGAGLDVWRTKFRNDSGGKFKENSIFAQLSALIECDRYDHRS